MQSRTWLFAAAMALSGLALAQAPMQSGVTESIDPAKIAAIEQHAQRLGAAPANAPAQMMGERGQMRQHGHMRHHEPMLAQHGKMHHHGSKAHNTKHKRAMHRRAMRERAPSDMPVANDGKR